MSPLAKGQSARHTVLFHRFLGSWEVSVRNHVLHIESLLAALANDDGLRPEATESVVQSVLTHVGSIASGNFWDEESTFAPIKMTGDERDEGWQVLSR